MYTVFDMEIIFMIDYKVIYEKNLKIKNSV
jgi:hypothetical protein